MGLQAISFLKNWFKNTRTREENWDEIAGKVTAYSGRTNNNLKQLGLDLNGSNYDFNNDGRATQVTPIVSRLGALESQLLGTLGTVNLGLDLSNVDVVSLVQADGNALSSTEYGTVTFNSTASAGQLTTRNVAANLQLPLVGCHWGFDTLGDKTNKKLWVLLIDTGSSVVLGVDATGDRKSVSIADSTIVNTGVNSIEKVYVTSVLPGTCDCTYLGWINADFDDTGNGGGENYWTLKSGVGDVNIGRGEIERSSLTLENQLRVLGESFFTGDVQVANFSAVGDSIGFDGTDPTSPISFDTDTVSQSGFGSFQAGDTNNLGLTLSGGVLSIVQANGNAINSLNSGWVCVPSTVAGSLFQMKISGTLTLQDDSNVTSHFTNFEAGVSAGANWASDVPWFLYAVNKGNTFADGTDGNSAVFISKNPNMSVTPSSANNIGDKAGIPATDDQTGIILFGTYTKANYVSLPCQLIGVVRMRYATATHDWTFQVLSVTDGFGTQKLQSSFGKVWTMPTGQSGAAAGSHIYDNAGTAPIFTTSDYQYTIGRSGYVEIRIDLSGDGGTDGAGAVTSLLSLPYAISFLTGRAHQSHIGLALGQTTIAGGTPILGEFTHGDTSTRLTYQSAVTTNSAIQNAMFSNGNRSIEANFRYKAF